MLPPFFPEVFYSDAFSYFLDGSIISTTPLKPMMPYFSKASLPESIFTSVFFGFSIWS